MNDMTLALDFEHDASSPYAAIFTIEQEFLRKEYRKTLDAFEKGSIAFHYKQTFDPHERIIGKVQRSKDDEKSLIQGALVSLIGPNGILPTHYSESLAKALRDKDTVFKDFLDIFNHRVNSLMYRSWAKYRLDTDKFYQAHVKQYQSTIDLMMSTFAGEAFPNDKSPSLYFGGLTYATTKSAKKIENIIKELTGLKVDINEFKGKWIELADDQLSRMKSREQGQSFNQLGVNLMLGRRCWDLSSGFEVEFEVKDKETFASLTPGGATHQLLRKTIKKLVGDNFDFSFKLKVKEAHCRRVSLKKEGKSSKLGASAWMGKSTANDRTINYYC